MTPTAWITILAALVLFAGVAASVRLLAGPRQLVGILGTLAAVTVIGWIAWYVGIQV